MKKKRTNHNQVRWGWEGHIWRPPPSFPFSRTCCEERRSFVLNTKSPINAMLTAARKKACHETNKIIQPKRKAK